MKSEQIRKHHIESFAKLSLSKRLAWAFSQEQFLDRFMNAESAKVNRKLRRNGKKYFSGYNLA
jgi:hypothetical protein